MANKLKNPFKVKSPDNRVIKLMNKTIQLSVKLRLTILVIFIPLLIFAINITNLQENRNVIIHLLCFDLMMLVAICIYWIVLSFIKSANIRKIGAYFLTAIFSMMMFITTMGLFALMI